MGSYDYDTYLFKPSGMIFRLPATTDPAAKRVWSRELWFWFWFIAPRSGRHLLYPNVDGYCFKKNLLKLRAVL